MSDPKELNSLIYNNIIDSCQGVREYQLSKLSPTVRKCCEYFYVKMHSTVTLEDLSRICFLSPHYISDLFRKELGMSAISYFRKMKLNFSLYFLRHTDLSINDIATTLDYPSHSHFTQQFKRVFGMTPSQYRKNKNADSSEFQSILAPEKQNDPHAYL